MAIYWWLYIHIDIHIHTYIHLLHFVYVLMPRFVSCRPNCIIQFLIRQVSYIISFLVIEWFSSNNATVKMKQWKLHDLSKMKSIPIKIILCHVIIFIIVIILVKMIRFPIRVTFVMWSSWLFWVTQWLQW